MDIIDEIKKIKEHLNIIHFRNLQLTRKMNKIIIKLNKINNISTYSSSEDSDIKYPDDSDYD